MNPPVKSGLDAAGPTRQLAEFAFRLSWDDLPAAVRHEAKRSLLNFLATALAGSADPTIAIAARVTGRFAGPGSATVIGRADTTDPLTAAFLNAASGNVFDFDDTHVGNIIHPTAPVAPVLFALAESTNVSGAAPLDGQRALLAFAWGVEVECRIGNAISPSHYARGWHITSTCGVFGAAAAASRILGLDARSTVWALGNASVQASGLVETLGTMSKSIGVGNSARNGLLSALLAADGFSGPERPIEGERGFLRVAADAPDPGLIGAGLGDDWQLLRNTYKPYPCGVVLNPVIEACLEMSSDPAIIAALRAGSIDAIEVVGHPLLRQRTDRPEPASGRESQVSAQHAVPIALLRGRAGLAEFSDGAVAAGEVRALGRKVRFVDDDRYSVEAACIRIGTAGGGRIERTIDAARGSLARPLTDADLERKLAELNDYGDTGVDVRALSDAVWTLDQSPDIAAVVRLAAGRRRGR